MTGSSSALGFILGIIVILFTQYIQRRLETYNLSRALLSEIKQIQYELENFQRLLKNETRSQLDDGKPLLPASLDVPILEITEDNIEIYSGNTSKIGFLNHDISALLVEYYRSIRFMKSQSEDWSMSDIEGSSKEKIDTLFARCNLLERINKAAMADGSKLMYYFGLGLIEGSFPRVNLPKDHFKSDFREALSKEDPVRIRTATKKKRAPST